MFSVHTKYSHIFKRHHLRVVAFAVLGLITGAVSMTLIKTEMVSIQEISSVITENGEQFEITGPVLPKSVPTRLRIPAVGIDTTFEGPLGLNADQTVEVPDTYESVGWYKFGPTPGELGPAVVLGHVDSYEGPAVFFTLRQVEIGDRIEIERGDGVTAIFEVTRLDQRLQTDFPTMDVYGDIDHAGLRLITCTGVYNHGTLEYSHNLIVYARLVESA